uniref:condensation domain-containing protein n=1 Tax=Shinella sumterensis TaxID=1967501 RepID=UPI003F872473
MNEQFQAERTIRNSCELTGLPLSTAQMEIWLATQLTESNLPYTVGEYLEIDGHVDIDRFRSAMEQLVAETDALHLRIINLNGEPRQVFGPIPKPMLQYVDLIGEADAVEAAAHFVQSELARPMDLEQGPLFAFCLLRVAPNRFWWLHRYHHIVVDGLSMGFLARRAAAIYTAIGHGRVAPEGSSGSLQLLLDDDAVYRRSAQFERDATYWAEQVSDAPLPVSLTGRTATSSTHHIRHSGMLPVAMFEPYLKDGQVGRDAASLAVAVMAVYVARLGEADEIVLKLPVRSRLKEPNRSSVVGMSANLLPLRLQVNTESSFQTLMHQTSQKIHELLRHQMYRGAELYTRVDNTSGSSISAGCGVNVMAFDYDFCFDDNPVRVNKFIRGLADDLTFVVYKATGSDLQIDLFGNSSLYSAAELEFHYKRLTHLLETIATDPEIKVGAIDVLLPSERTLLLEEWNRTEHVYPSERCVHQLFEDQVSANPEAIALEHDGELLSYGELNTRANRLAHRLIELGVGPDTLVAICVERSPAMVVGLLAIL